MAIKVSSYIALRNEGVGHLLDDYQGLRDEGKKKELRQIIEELDKLHLDVPKRTVIIGLGDVEIHDLCTDLKRSAELYERIHAVIKDCYVKPIVYRELGQAFEEIGESPLEDTAEAIKYGTTLFNRMNNRRLSFDPSRTMNWENIKKYGEKDIFPF